MSIEIAGIGKRFGSFVALENINLEIPTGQLTALLGPSGGGKSTLLRIIAGLEEVSDGEVVIGDRIVTDLAPKHRDIAMVFQNYEQVAAYSASFVLALIAVLSLVVARFIRPKEQTR